MVNRNKERFDIKSELYKGRDAAGTATEVTRICVIGPSKKFFSGVSAYTISLANALSKSNKVSVVTLRNLLPRFLYPGKENVGRQDYTIDFAPDIKTYEGMDWNSPVSWFKAYRFLKQEEPDVIIMQWWTSSVAHMQLFLALVNKLKIKANLVLEMHEIVDPLEQSMLPVRLYSQVLGKLIMRRADALVVHSASVKEQAIQTYYPRGDKVFVIPHGLYDNYFQDCPKETAREELGIKEEFVILCFGMIRKYKGVPYLVEAFNRLPEAIVSHSRLIIAGEDWGDEKGLGTLIGSSPHYRHITYEPKFVPDHLIPKYFSAADVAVLPYLRTSGSGVASLAMAYGKPIITSDLEVTKEWLQGYRGAIFVPAGDSISIAEKLSEIYTQYKAGEVISYDATQGTWDQVAKRYQQVMKQITTVE